MMYDYELLRTNRRTLSLEITPDCRVLVRAPLRMPQNRIETFVASKEDWIAGHLTRMQKKVAEAPPPPTEAEIAALKARARAVLPEKVAYWSAVMGLSPTGVKITSARRRYGSCSAKNSLCFSCFLMQQPEAAIDLVVVHELCHIRVKNHGPQFYALLAQYLPDYKARQKLLKE